MVSSRYILLHYSLKGGGRQARETEFNAMRRDQYHIASVYTRFLQEGNMDKNTLALAIALLSGSVLVGCNGSSNNNPVTDTPPTADDDGNDGNNSDSGILVFAASDSGGSVVQPRGVTALAAAPSEFLYKTDGTPDGTIKIVDDNGNGFEVGRFGSGYMAELDGTFYFAGKDSNGDVELWATDGTGAGTERVADIYPNGNGQPHNMVPAAGKLFMNAVVDGFGRELVVYDPVSGNKQVLSSNINGSPTSNTSPTSLTSVDDGLFFFDRAAGDIYFTDGTLAGTAKIATNNDTTNDPNSSLAKYPELIEDGDWLGYNGKLLFTGRFNVLDAETRLYELDRNGVIKEISFDDGGNTVRLDITQNVVASNGKVYFVADSTAGLHIFEYDGSTVTNLTTREGSRPYQQNLTGTSLGVFMPVERRDSGVDPYLFYVGNTGGSTGIGGALRGPTGRANSFSLAFNLVDVDGTVFLTATAEGSGGADFGIELWKTDGNNPGTQLVKDINDQTAGADSVPSPLIPIAYQVPPTVTGSLEGKYFFFANDGSQGFEPWV